MAILNRVYTHMQVGHYRPLLDMIKVKRNTYTITKLLQDIKEEKGNEA